MVNEGVVVWYNPQCSNCIGAEELLALHGVPAHHVYYLDDPPTRNEIVQVLGLLGAANPTELMRTSDPPVVIWANRAVIARPPQLLLPLLERCEIG